MRGPSQAASSDGCSSGLKKGPWTAEEDEALAAYVKREGEGKWRTLPKKAGLLRCGKSCRLRWMNYLRPSVKRGHITEDEEDLILRLHRLLGNRWSLIAGRIPGRTDNEIKNYWNTHLSKKLISQGIDPKTHKPLLNPIGNKLHDQFSINSSDKSVPNSSFNIHDVPISPENGNNILVGDAENCSDKKELIINTSIDHQQEGTMSDEDDDMMISCFPDEAFSSFLNSLINDDMFNNNQQQEQEQEIQPAATD